MVMTSKIMNGDGTVPDDTKQSFAPVNAVGLLGFSYCTVQVRERERERERRESF